MFKQQTTVLFSLLLPFLLTMAISCRNVSDISSTSVPLPLPPFLVDGEVNGSSFLNSSGHSRTETSVFDGRPIGAGGGHRRWKSQGRTGHHLKTLLKHLTDDQPMDDNFRAKDEEDIRKMIIYNYAAGGIRDNKNNNETMTRTTNVISRHRIAETTVHNGTTENNKATLYSIQFKEQQQQLQYQQTLLKQQSTQKKMRKESIGKAVKIVLFKQSSNKSSSDTLRGSSSTITPSIVLPPSAMPPQQLGKRRQQIVVLNAVGSNAAPPAIASHSPGTSAQPPSPSKAMQLTTQSEGTVKWHNKQQKKDKMVKKKLVKKNKRKKMLLLRRIFKTAAAGGHGISRENRNNNTINATTTTITLEPKLNGITVPLNDKITNDEAIKSQQRWNGTSNAKTVPCNVFGHNNNNECRHFNEHNNCCPTAECSTSACETIVAQVIGGGGNDQSVIGEGGNDQLVLRVGCQQMGQSLEGCDEQQQQQFRRRKMQPIVFPALPKKDNEQAFGKKDIDGIA